MTVRSEPNGTMAVEINEGSVPAYYREVYEAICSQNHEKVRGDVFQRLLESTKLSKAVQAQISEHVDASPDGFLSKLSLYKALALIAIAQQGKQPSPKALDNYVQELPKPRLGQPGDLRALRVQPAPEDELTLSPNLDGMLEKDAVNVKLIPEKKGLFLKHVEYQVTSLQYKMSVYRRYSDFDVFHEILLQRFSYRIVPSLPPKRMLKGVLTSVSEQEFIEGRRRALCRFLNLVAQHHILSKDDLVKTFFTFSGSDVQIRLRDIYKKMGDEFMTNRVATLAKGVSLTFFLVLLLSKYSRKDESWLFKEYLPADIQAQFAASRELIKNIHNSFSRLREKAEKIAERSKGNANDLLMFGNELGTLGSETFFPPLASSQNTWGRLRQSLKSLSSEFSVLSEKAAAQGRREEDEVVERLNLFLDLLQSYRDLCERHEKGVLHEHQRALHKYGVMKRQMMSAAATAQPKEQTCVEQLESRIVQQENAIQVMELRNYFSLFCLHQETQLIFNYLPVTSHILGAFVNSQVQGHQEMGAVWKELQPKLSCFFGEKNGVK